MEQIAVGGVDLDQIDIQSGSTFCGLSELVADFG